VKARLLKFTGVVRCLGSWLASLLRARVSGAPLHLPAQEFMSDPVPRDFVFLASEWCEDQSAILLAFVWQGYDLLSTELPAGINLKDLERSITQSLELRIRRVMTGDEPFDMQHSPRERETMKPSPAQPPEYDLAFVLRAEERVMWPLEAKVLETDGAVRDYVEDIRNEFLTCRYAPFSSESAMLAYLLSGTPENVFRNVTAKLPCSLEGHPRFPRRPHRVSKHQRPTKAGKVYPRDFRCHHLVLEFPGLTRGSDGAI